MSSPDISRFTRYELKIKAIPWSVLFKRRNIYGKRTTEEPAS